MVSGKIRDMLPKDVLDNDSRLVLVNAMYFKGTWNKTFEWIDTYDAKFRLNKVKLHKETLNEL